MELEPDEITSIRVRGRTKNRFNQKKRELISREIQRIASDEDVINFLLDQTDYYARVFNLQNPMCPKCGVKPVDYAGQTCTDCFAERFLKVEGADVNERNEDEATTTR